MAGKRRVPAPPGFYGCARCREVKPVSEFFRHATGPDGHSCVCKVCKQAHRAALREQKRHEPDPTIEARFWPKVDRSGGDDACWNWIGALSNRGYGAIYYKGADQPAHRVSMELAGHQVNYRTEVVDHVCKNIRCVNPRHLRICSQRDNCVTFADSPFGINSRKTHCKYGHPLSGENLARVLNRGKSKAGTWLAHRYCLTCWPNYHGHPRRFFLPEDLGNALERNR